MSKGDKRSRRREMRQSWLLCIQMDGNLVSEIPCIKIFLMRPSDPLQLRKMNLLLLGRPVGATYCILGPGGKLLGRKRAKTSYVAILWDMVILPIYSVVDDITVFHYHKSIPAVIGTKCAKMVPYFPELNPSCL